MDCPICGLANPNCALKCDCGYSFENKSKYNIEITKKRNITKKVKKAYTFSVILFGIGLFLLLVLVISLNYSKYPGNLIRKSVSFYLDEQVPVKIKGIPLLPAIGLFGIIYNYIKLRKLQNTKRLHEKH